MKIFHTADWHLGKLVQGVHMTEDQRFIIDQFIQAVEQEKPDAIIIAGDLYDRAVPPTEAVQLLNETLEKIILELKIPVLAIGGNHDSPSRLNFGNKMMQQNGLYIVGQLSKEMEPVVLQDEDGEVHFHLIPYCDPSVVRNIFDDETIRTHDDAGKKIVEKIKEQMDPAARHVYIGHAFVTPMGEETDNTSDSERPLTIGGAEYVNSSHFSPFHYTALGHLHQAHPVADETIRYAGSILKYSISEEYHKKGFNVVTLQADGTVEVERRRLIPKRDMRTVEASLDELFTHEINEDYVFVRLTDKAPILSPMEKVRSVYPNAMHVERQHFLLPKEATDDEAVKQDRSKLSDLDLFQAFYKEVKGVTPSEETEVIFTEVLNDLLQDERETEKVPSN